MTGTKRDCQCPRARHQHGTRRAYEADRCRCLRCRAAHANATAAYRAGGRWREFYLDAAATKARLQALSAVGVTTRRIAAHTGLSTDMICYLRRGRQRQVTPRLAGLVEAAYDALWLKGRSDPDARRCSTQALAAGYERCAAEYTYVPDDLPFGIDEIAVERAMRGDRVKLTKQERAEAVSRMTKHGYSASEIADRLGTTKRTVTRRRSNRKAA